MNPEEVVPISPTLAYYEAAIAGAEHNPEHVLNLALTEQDVFIVQLGLVWMTFLYGERMTNDISARITELIRAQEFCQCSRCKARREESA